MKTLLAFILLALIACTNRPEFEKHLKEQVGPSVYYVLETSFGGGGTGFAITTSTGHTVIITNEHVCRGAGYNTLYIRNSEYEPLTPVTPIKIDIEHDLCALQAPKDAKPLHLGPGNFPFQYLYVIGHPHLAPLIIKGGTILYRGSLTVDEGSALECPPAPNFRLVGSDPIFGPRCVASFDGWETDLETAPGNSGSPVITEKGEVVGVLFAGDGVTSSIVPMEYLKALLDTL